MKGLDPTKLECVKGSGFFSIEYLSSGLIREKILFKIVSKPQKTRILTAANKISFLKITVEVIGVAMLNNNREKSNMNV